MKYEYTSMRLSGDDAAARMNALGAEGWEAFAVTTPTENEPAWAYFRRPIAEGIKLTPEEVAAITGSGKITYTPADPLAEWREVLEYFYNSTRLVSAGGREMSERARRLLGR